MIPSGLEVQERDEAGRAVLTLTGELDIASAPRFQQTIARLCVTEEASVLTLDLSGLSFIDSIGLAAIVYASRLCERHDCELAVIRGPEAVQSVFELTGLARQLPFRSDGDGAADGHGAVDGDAPA
ncbi:MAG TPA: STAS domain-containing protein [Solirubrobacteraceae bacterium]|jgi:anti-sigma B factor antagonist|nr:STAS domain-containing protein [Solirubrobacteraceae bacterium]